MSVELETQVLIDQMAKEMKAAPKVVLDLEPELAFGLAGCLQLALTHPETSHLKIRPVLENLLENLICVLPPLAQKVMRKTVTVPRPPLVITKDTDLDPVERERYHERYDENDCLRPEHRYDPDGHDNLEMGG